MLEVHPERVDPEPVEVLGIAHRDVTGDALRRSRTCRTGGTTPPAVACGAGAPPRRSRTWEERPGREAVQSCRKSYALGVSCHSVRSASAGRIRAADRAGRAASRLARSDRGGYHQQHGDQGERRHVHNREVVGEPPPYEPAGTMPSGTPTIRPADRDQRRLPRDREASLAAGESEGAQHCELVPPAPDGRDERVGDGGRREQREEHTQRERERAQLTEADHRGREHARVRSGMHRSRFPSPRAGAPPSRRRPPLPTSPTGSPRRRWGEGGSSVRPRPPDRPGSATRSGRSRCARTPGGAQFRRPSRRGRSRCLRQPGHRRATSASRSVPGPNAISSARLGARPSSTTGEMAPFSVSIANVGVVTPLMRTFRTQNACSTPSMS